MQANAEAAASLMKMLSNPARLLILCSLVDQERTAGELEGAAGLSQSAVSQHLARLRSEGLVETRRDGQRVIYSLKDENAKDVIHYLHSLFCH